jgi:hypothetical protein
MYLLFANFHIIRDEKANRCQVSIFSSYSGGLRFANPPPATPPIPADDEAAAEAIVLAK